MKKFIKTIFILILLSIIGGSIYFYSTMIAPTKLNVRQEEITSSQIPEEFDDIKIVFFSDTHLNKFVDEERFGKVIDLINSQMPDIVLFGGDLFDHPSNQIPSNELIETTTEYLNKIEAPLGKFAILGNHDHESASTAQTVSTILTNANFEMVTNKTLRLRNRSAESILLAGIDSELLGNPDIESVFNNIQASDFSIILCHTPDTILLSPTEKIDLFLSGHGHGGQIYIPIFGAMYKAPYAEQYYRGKHRIDDALLDVTNGTGTTRMDIRFMADAEIVVYTLHNQISE